MRCRRSAAELIRTWILVLTALAVSGAANADPDATLESRLQVAAIEHRLQLNSVDGRFSGPAWELLLSMLILESAFGIPGLVAAPIYYAYLKAELSEKGLA